MSNRRKPVVDWDKISYTHKLVLLQEAGIDLSRLTQEDVKNFGRDMFERAGKNEHDFRIARRRVFPNRIGVVARNPTSAHSRARRKMPPRRKPH